MTTTTAHFHHLLLPATCAALFAAAPLLAQADATQADAAQADTSQADTRRGRIIDAPDNINNFHPEPDFVAVDATTVDLAQVLGDLGSDAQLWYQHVMTLSNPFFEGRQPQSPGMDRAGEYVEWWFQKYDLEPAFPSTEGGEWDSYRQHFEVRSRRMFTRVTVTDAVAKINGVDLVEDEQFAVAGASGSGGVTAPVTFVGYGIEDGEDDYTSFDEDTDLTGRIALVLRYEPLDDEGRSRWNPERFSRNSSMSRKIRAVAERNPAAIIVANPPGAMFAGDDLESTNRTTRYARNLEIPLVQVTTEVAAEIVTRGTDGAATLEGLRALADEGLLTTRDLSDDLKMTLSATVEQTGDEGGGRQAYNVGGVLRGQGALADQWVIIGGHYDHVGYGRFGGAEGVVHPGADDNASGTAGVLVLIRRFTDYYANAEPDEELRSILFMTFSAEEMGLVGSRHYVENLTIPKEQISGMLNMDMIGRVRSDTVAIYGAGSATIFPEQLEPFLLDSGMTCALSTGTSGRSDEANFLRAGIPGIHFFSGLHDVYHRPGDQGYTVNPRGATMVLDLVESIGLWIAKRPEMLEFDAGE